MYVLLGMQIERYRLNHCHYSVLLSVTFRPLYSAFINIAFHPYTNGKYKKGFTKSEKILYESDLQKIHLNWLKQVVLHTAVAKAV